MSSNANSPNSQSASPPQPPTDPKKRHACPTCSRAFTTSGHLARHIRVHTGERNHKCPFPGCETRCSRQDNLQQHYRIHLSPGSRRSSSVRRNDSKKRSSLSQSITAPAITSTARSPEDPPDTPPALARATILPPLPLSLQRSNPYTLRPDGNMSGRPGHSSPSNSSSGSPHSVYSSMNDTTNSVASASANGAAGGSPFGNVLGLSHERTQSPPGSTNGTTPEYASAPNPYPSYHSPSASTSAAASTYRPSDSYSLSTSSYSLPPIHSLEQTQQSAYSLNLGRGSYPSYENSASTQWSHHHQGQGAYGQHNWWGGSVAAAGVVGAGQRGYAQSYGA